MGSTGATLLRALLFASLFAGFAAHLAAGEKDCYDERDSVMRMCKWTIKKGGPYVIPDMPCRLEVRKVDMPCICRVLTAADERIISPEKLVRCSRDSGVALPVGSKCGTTIRACVRSSDHGIVREEGEGRAGGDVRGE